MKYLESNLKELRYAYELRGFYNTHKYAILSDEDSYDLILNHAHDMKRLYTYDSLDMNTIENFIIDLEDDKDAYDNPRPSKPKEQIFSEPIKSNNRQIENIRHNLTPSKYVKVEILDYDCENIMDEIQYETFRISLFKVTNQTELAKLLGISIRTVRNYLTSAIKREGKDENLN